MRDLISKIRQHPVRYLGSIETGEALETIVTEAIAFFLGDCLPARSHHLAVTLCVENRLVVEDVRRATDVVEHTQAIERALSSLFAYDSVSGRHGVGLFALSAVCSSLEIDVARCVGALAYAAAGGRCVSSERGARVSIRTRVVLTPDRELFGGAKLSVAGLDQRIKEMARAPLLVTLLDCSGGGQRSFGVHISSKPTPGGARPSPKLVTRGPTLTERGFVLELEPPRVRRLDQTPLLLEPGFDAHAYLCRSCSHSSPRVSAYVGSVGRPGLVCEQCVWLAIEIAASRGAFVGAEASSRRSDDKSAPYADEKLQDALLGGLLSQKPDLPFHCMFCDGGQEHGAILISGPRVWVCTDCVVAAKSLVSL